MSLQTVLSTDTLKTQVSNQIDVIQTALGHQGLSEATIRAQQELSEKFGIPTFDIVGNISTVPQTRAIDETINVGTGRFTESAFKKSIQALAPEQSLFDRIITGFNDSITKPIQAIFDTIFTDRVINELPPELQQRIKEIDDRITLLESRLKPRS